MACSIQPFIHDSPYYHTSKYWSVFRISLFTLRPSLLCTLISVHVHVAPTVRLPLKHTPTQDIEHEIYIYSTINLASITSSSLCLVLYLASRQRAADKAWRGASNPVDRGKGLYSNHIPLMETSYPRGCLNKPAIMNPTVEEGVGNGASGGAGVHAPDSNTEDGQSSWSKVSSE